MIESLHYHVLVLVCRSEDALVWPVRGSNVAMNA